MLPEQKPCDVPNCHEWIDKDGPDTCESCHGLDMEGKKEMADE